MSTTVERKGCAVAVPDMVADNLLACPACSQEMLCIGEELPIHRGDGKLCEGSTSRGVAPKCGQMIREPFIPSEVFKSFSISEVLSADTCLSCGGAKLPGQTLCGGCHGRLPYVHSQALPSYMKHYLFADEHKIVTGHYTRKTFKEIFVLALEKLQELRAPINGNNEKLEAVGVTD